MIYRNRVEFAVGHGVAVHAETAEDVTLATEVRTTVMPQYEVQVTETPGLILRSPGDEGDGQQWSARHAAPRELGCRPLVDALNMLTKDYAAWIDEQRARIGADVTWLRRAGATGDGSMPVRSTLRLQQGIDTLKSDKTPSPLSDLPTGRWPRSACEANTRWMFGGARIVTVEQVRCVEEPQLAPVPVGVPAAVDPFAGRPIASGPRSTGRGLCRPAVVPHRRRKDRGLPGRGGLHDGHTAHAGQPGRVRRFARSGRDHAVHAALADAAAVPARHCIDLCDGSASTRSAGKGDKSLGTEPFTIGLWVGNKVTPGHDRRQPSCYRRHPQPWQVQRWNGFSRSADQLSVVWL
jgi:hypothetical protein